jgi:hypothetical protein
MARLTEVYGLTCHGCQRDLELPAGRADRPEARQCPQCGARLAIEFRPAGDETAGPPWRYCGPVGHVHALTSLNMSKRVDTFRFRPWGHRKAAWCGGKKGAT